MSRLIPGFLAAGLLGACAVSSNRHLVDSGYSIVPPVAGGDDAFAYEIHLNQLRQLGGDINSAEFHRFVAAGLKDHGICRAGWEPLPCVQDSSCVQHTRRSVTVHGRCVTS
jgi:hypothetical protein